MRKETYITPVMDVVKLDNDVIMESPVYCNSDLDPCHPDIWSGSNTSSGSIHSSAYCDYDTGQCMAHAKPVP